MKNLRLNEIYNFMQGGSAIDIGTDHGYLLIHLAKNGYNKLLGVEVVVGPYENCIKNIKKNGLDNIINTVLSDGLNKVDIQEAKKYNNIVISGMGGDLITKIISNDIDKFRNSYLVLQPNNNEDKLRSFLNENQFEIIKENIILDNKKFYEIILCKYNENTNYKLTIKEILFGSETLYTKEEFHEKWSSEEEYLEGIVDELIKNNKEIPQKIKDKLMYIKEIRREYEVGKNNK